MAEQKNPQAQPELSLSEQTRIRREKLANLQAEGQNPFEITRYDVPSLNGFNFVMKHALGGGATMSLRLDSLGKSMGSAVMRMKIHVEDGEL